MTRVIPLSDARLFDLGGKRLAASALRGMGQSLEAESSLADIGAQLLRLQITDLAGEPLEDFPRVLSSLKNWTTVHLSAERAALVAHRILVFLGDASPAVTELVRRGVWRREAFSDE